MKAQIEERDGFAYVALRNSTRPGAGLQAQLLRVFLLPQWHALLQAAILVLSAAAIWLVALPAGDPLRPWGYVVGLASQPLWLAATWRARQWGMLALSVFYVGAWAQGIANHFH